VSVDAITDGDTVGLMLNDDLLSIHQASALGISSWPPPEVLQVPFEMVQSTRPGGGKKVGTVKEFTFKRRTYQDIEPGLRGAVYDMEGYPR
jgi:hypothetical protein